MISKDSPYVSNTDDFERFSLYFEHRTRKIHQYEGSLSFVEKQ
ncbi:hypothetical protein HanXRQr2_Chr12g0523211 [Helianthus annuus]|uniref:Uncharacterized protein n=1 Tax=Helianthus annuus TaxID=4232 RepID=A0A9K3EQ50_HELAN|nr:hypothetical protein HanXRQr2_Chr12g0523211 [Helianthus annuus]